MVDVSFEVSASAPASAPNHIASLVVMMLMPCLSPSESLLVSADLSGGVLHEGFHGAVLRVVRSIRLPRLLAAAASHSAIQSSIHIPNKQTGRNIPPPPPTKKKKCPQERRPTKRTTVSCATVSKSARQQVMKKKHT